MEIESIEIELVLENGKKNAHTSVLSGGNNVESYRHAWAT